MNCRRLLFNLQTDPNSTAGQSEIIAGATLIAEGCGNPVLARGWICSKPCSDNRAGTATKGNHYRERNPGMSWQVA